MKKKFLLLLFVCLIAVSLLVFSACDKPEDDGGNDGNGDQTENGGTEGLAYYPLPDGTYGVMAGTTKYLNTITIPAKHNGKAVTQILPEAFKSADNLTAINIPNSVTSIGKDAFASCYGLTSVNYLGDIASWCAIDFDANPVEYAGKFYLNGTLVTDLVIPDSVTSIGGFAFNGCRGLTSITIPDSVTSIGNSAFNGCRGLTSVTIGNSVTSIGDWAFSDCTGLTSITMPDRVTSIGDYAFYECTKLTSIKSRGTGEQWNAISKGSYWDYDYDYYYYYKQLNYAITYNYTGE